MYVVYTQTNNSAQVKFQQAYFNDSLFLIPEAIPAMYRQPQHERKALLIGSHYFCQLTCISQGIHRFRGFSQSYVIVDATDLLGVDFRDTTAPLGATLLSPQLTVFVAGARSLVFLLFLGESVLSSCLAASSQTPLSLPPLSLSLPVSLPSGRVWLGVGLYGCLQHLSHLLYAGQQTTMFLHVLKFTERESYRMTNMASLYTVCKDKG
jgi:hypothetical protein